MQNIEITVETNGDKPKSVTVAEDATVEQLLKAAGADIGGPDEQIILRVEDRDISCRPSHRLREHGIGHGHRLHWRPREVVIIVNTRPKPWEKPEISYEQVVVLAFGAYSSDLNVVYTVNYKKGPVGERDGSLVKGESVKVKKDMIFNVSQTNKS